MSGLLPEDLDSEVDNIKYLTKQKQKEVAIKRILGETIPFSILELINKETEKKGGGYENDDKINKEFMIETILNKINEEGIDMSVFNKEDIDKFLDEYVENYIKQIEENINNAKKRYEILDYPTQWEWEYEYLAEDWGEIIIKIEEEKEKIEEKKRIMATQIALSKTTELTVPNIIINLLSETLKETHN